MKQSASEFKVGDTVEYIGRPPIPAPEYCPQQGDQAIIVSNGLKEKEWQVKFLRGKLGVWNIHATRIQLCVPQTE